MSDTKTASVILSGEDLEFLDNYAEKNGLSRSSLLRMIVKEWIRKEKEEEGQSR